MRRFAQLTYTTWVTVALLATLFVALLLSSCSEKPDNAPSALDVSSLSHTMTIDDLHGYWVYIDFWASWCPPCLDSLPWLENMEKKYGDKMYFITVNGDAKAQDRDRFIEQIGIQLPVIVDQKGRLMRLFEVQGLPTALIISPSGIIIHRKEGFMVEKQDYYERIIRSALGLDLQQDTSTSPKNEAY